MKIIIAGASDVGLHLAKLLSFESQDITLIDSVNEDLTYAETCLLYTSPSPRDKSSSRMPSSA